MIATLADAEAMARSVLAADVYSYVAGGAGDESAIARNRAALDEHRLVPRVLRAVNDVDPSVSLLGRRHPAPLLVAPTAVQRLLHPAGELAVAAACAAHGVTMALSMNSGTSVEDVAATGVDVSMQLYVPSDRDHVRRILERAIAAGASSLMVTVDQAGVAVRYRELRTPLHVPEWYEFVHLPTSPDQRGVDGDLTWADIEWLRELSSVPLLLKGVLHPDDARIAADVGVDAIVVSNHGGRQLDRVVSAYDVLPRIRESVGDSMVLLADGSIRSGGDVVVALALGADATMDRPP